ncbi:hypothetical protein RRG08_051362 [Elysia crispata]|uniref:Uncharacterized protein n=1 Tax=Elysia crispata TaxID=231223 RepID=A0AAE1E9P7_9GAST|nr:hypothetical protein RRG08_051362 [Elysia crispata]
MRATRPSHIYLCCRARGQAIASFQNYPLEDVTILFHINILPNLLFDAAVNQFRRAGHPPFLSPAETSMGSQVFQELNGNKIRPW